jgi:shikimate kinase
MSTTSRRIFIIGFMGAGKTTVASALARLADCGMIDLDSFITEREGRTPQQFINEDGEAHFREIESSALRAALEDEAARVVALGGGTWTLEQNRMLIAEHGGFTVWLDAPFELCWRRIKRGRSLRPLARDHEQAHRLYDERRSLYALAALHVQVTAERSAEDIVTEIARFTTTQD